MKTMQGTLNVTFFDLFADTLNTHGIEFAHKYYVIKNKMSMFEFRVWMKAVRLGIV